MNWMKLLSAATVLVVVATGRYALATPPSCYNGCASPLLSKCYSCCIMRCSSADQVKCQDCCDLNGNC